MEVKKTSAGHVIVLNNMPAIGGLRPCADITYDSLKQSGYEQIVCVVLTGMERMERREFFHLKNLSLFTLFHRMQRVVWYMVCRKQSQRQVL